MQVKVTFDSDVAGNIQARMRERGVSLNEAMNAIIRQAERRRLRTETASMGKASIDLTHALRLAGELEDIHLSHRMSQDQS